MADYAPPSKPLPTDLASWATTLRADILQWLQTSDLDLEDPNRQELLSVACRLGASVGLMHGGNPMTFLHGFLHESLGNNVDATAFALLETSLPIAIKAFGVTGAAASFGYNHVKVMVIHRDDLSLCHAKIKALDAFLQRLCKTSSGGGHGLSAGRIELAIDPGDSLEEMARKLANLLPPGNQHS